MGIYNFVSLLGMFLLFVLAYVCSTNRKLINWHVVVWGIGLQLLIAWFLFVFPAGAKVFVLSNDLVIALLDSASAGAKFLFGPLAFAPGTTSLTGESSIGFILAFQAFPTIIFFSSLMAILYYLNILPRIIQSFAYLFTKLMNVSGAEALCASSNIFVGIESALTVKPFLAKMTKSELCTILAAGMATVSSNVLAIYVYSLQSTFSNIAGHLVTASFLSAPAALAMSKVLLPETGHPITRGEDVKVNFSKDSSLFEAIINGAQAGVKLIVGISALLIAVLGLVALLDAVLGFIGTNIGLIFNTEFNWSLKGILGIIFYPLVAIIGVPLSDISAVATLVGERLIVTEVTAYVDLASMIKSGAIEHPRSAVIATYALCGFAHLASMAIFVGGIAALVPERTKDLADVGLRALAAATLACLLTGCVAGLFFIRGSFLLGG